MFRGIIVWNTVFWILKHIMIARNTWEKMKNMKKGSYISAYWIIFEQF